MSEFTWDYDGESIKIIFSLIRNARWMDDDRDAVFFDYLDYEDVCVMKVDLDEAPAGDEIWNMILQVGNLETT